MMIYGKKTICVAVVLVMVVTTGTWAEDPYEVAWKAQIGSSGRERNGHVAVDASGNVYVTGVTDGDVGGPNAGDEDVFLGKFDSGGNELWAIQIGSSQWDQGYSVATDSSGNVYVSGRTKGDLGGPNAGDVDAFVRKLDSGGNEVWTAQIGTSVWDGSSSVAVDASGNAYISGVTYGDIGGPSAGKYDAFVSKFDSGGNEVWTTQIGSSNNDSSASVAVDASGNVYISGRTAGDLGGPFAGVQDAYVSKFDSGGNELWTTHMGTSEWDESFSVAVDTSGNAYISGSTKGNLGGPYAGGHADAFLSKFDPGGNEVWTTQIGTSDYDKSYSVALDAFGNAYISGETWGDLGGPNAGGPHDAFLSKFDPDGNEVWTTQIGTSSTDASNSVAVDASGNVYISGLTYGDFGGPNAGYGDAFVVKYEVPEPATLGMLALGGLAMLRRRRWSGTMRQWNKEP